MIQVENVIQVENKVDEEWRVKICDFGLARIVTEDTMRTTSLAQGVIGYRAWEFQFPDKFREKFPGQFIKGDMDSMAVALLRGDVWGWAMMALVRVSRSYAQNIFLIPCRESSLARIRWRTRGDPPSMSAGRKSKSIHAVSIRPRANLTE